jgi:hypothetical protein
MASINGFVSKRAGWECFLSCIIVLLFLFKLQIGSAPRIILGLKT